MIEPTVSTLDEVHAAVPTRQAANGDLFVAAAFDAHRTELFSFLRRATNDAAAAGTRDVGITATPDGSILIVGWGQVPNLDAGFKSFVIRVTRTPG